MKKIGIITSDREFPYYKNLLSNYAYECVNIKGVDDFQEIEQLIIIHQPYNLLRNKLIALGIQEVLEQWLQNNTVLTFGFATNYVISKFSHFPIKVRGNELNVLESSKVYIYPSIEPYSAVCIPNLEVELLNGKVEVISKWKEKIVGVRLMHSIGYFFLPTKETEQSLIIHYIK